MLNYPNRCSIICYYVKLCRHKYLLAPARGKHFHHAPEGCEKEKIDNIRNNLCIRTVIRQKEKDFNLLRCCFKIGTYVGVVPFPLGEQLKPKWAPRIIALFLTAAFALFSYFSMKLKTEYVQKL